MSEPDSRLLPILYPQVPTNPNGLVSWAKSLINALTEDQRNREAFAEFKNLTLTYASTIAYRQFGNIVKTTTVHATGDATINAVASAAGLICFIITNDATSGKTITFGTNFKSTGVLVGTTSKTAVVLFASDGSTLYEIARTTGLT